MSDDVKRDRDEDSSIDTELDLGSLDDIVLDAPADGDAGVEKGKGRKPNSSTTKKITDFVKGAVGGVASGAGAAVMRQMPETRVIATTVSETLSDVQELREDLSKQLAPLGIAVENASRKFLPKVEKVLPKTTYQKIKKKLDERHEARTASTYTPKSQATIDAETVKNELETLFGAQSEVAVETARLGEKNVLIDRTLGSMRHKQTTLQLVHLYDAVRSTELFHKTQHLAYMKKSLELKYKHVFIARDTLNLLRTSMAMQEGYMKAIVDNTALPDMMKQKSRDFIYGSRTKAYGEMMSSALGNIRGKIINHLKAVKDQVTGTLGMATDGLNMYADMSDMGMGDSDPGIARLLGRGVGWLGSYLGLGTYMDDPKRRGTVGAINNRLAGFRASMATRMSDLKQRMYNSNNPLLEGLSALLPDPFRPQKAASNDLVTSPDKAVAFDVITRQSITEIIPGYLSKIWHEVAMMRTGDENLEEQVYNVYERRFTGTSRVKEAIYAQSFGTEETRKYARDELMGTLQAGIARNKQTVDASAYYKGYSKDINQVFINHAVQVAPFRPNEILDYVTGGPETPYITKIIGNLEHDGRDVLSKIADAIYHDGKLDTGIVNQMENIINERYRKSDAHKVVLAKSRELYGYNDLMANDDLIRSSLSGAASMNLDRISTLQGALVKDNVVDTEHVKKTQENVYQDLKDFDEFSGKVKDKFDRTKSAAGRVARTVGGAIKGAFAHITPDWIKSRSADVADRLSGFSESIKSTTSTVAGGVNDRYRHIREEAKRKAAEKEEERKRADLDKDLFAETPAGAPRQSKMASSIQNTFLPKPVTVAIPGTTIETPSAAAMGSGTTERPAEEQASFRSDTLDAILEQITGWRSEVSTEHGLIFDAAAQIDETIRGLKLTGVTTEGGMSFTASAPEGKKGGRLGRGIKAAGRGLAAGIKNVGKAYTRIYGAALKGAGTAIKGLSGLASTTVGRAADLVKRVGRWATHKEDYVDIYVKGREGGMPLVSARKQRDPDEGIFFKSTGKRVMKSADIDQPCVDKSGNLVITEDDLKAGLVMSNSSPIGKLGAGMLKFGQSYLGLYSTAIKSIAGVAKTALKVLFGARERYVDVYRKDEILKGPLLTARKQKEEGVYFFASGNRVDKTSDIHEPICDRDKKILISKEDIEHGLVDVNNKPLGTGSGGLIGAMMPGLKKLGGIAGAGAKSLAGIYGTAYKGILDLGISGLKGAGKFLGRALGLDFSKSGGLGDGEQTISILQKMQADLALIADQYRNKSPLDADGDGDIDGSYADQQQKKLGYKPDRIDARDVHKDVDWLKKDEEAAAGEGGGEGDSGWGLTDLIPGKWGRKIRKWTNGRALARLAGRKLAPVGRGLMTAGRFLGGRAAMAGRFLGGKALALGAKALPFLGSVGSTAMGALGSAGSAVAGGLASLGPALASFAGPAALAALAGYGIYRGVKGFSKENALKNVGESAGISNENQLTMEDRLASAFGMNTKLGAKAVRGVMSVNPIIGLIKGIRGNDNPLTDKEIAQGRAKLQRRIDKGLPGYDRILQEYDKAVEAGNWMRARQLSGKEADGIIASLWKHSITGKLTMGTIHLLFGNDNKEMSAADIEKVRAKYNSIIKRGGPTARNAQRLLDKFEDYVADGDWKRARQIAGTQFQSKGLFGSIASGVKNFFVADKDKPMTESEVKEARARLEKLASSGNKAAQKVLDQFDEAVTEMNWKKARKLIGAETISGLRAVGRGLGTTAKWIARIGTLGISTLFESDQDTPMTEGEIKKFTDKMNYIISKNRDKTAQRKLERFEEYVVRQQWSKARKLAKEPHKTLMRRAASAVFDWAIGSDDKEMTEQEITKFRESMERKIKLGGGLGKTAQRKLDAFEDAVGMQNWRKARMIAGSPNDGLLAKAAKGIGKGIANTARFFFGGDGQPMSASEIEQARKEMGWAIQEGKSGAQKRLDMFDDYVADEKWNKARRLAKMPYKNVASRTISSIGDFLFGNDKDAMTPNEINRYRGELEQKIADAPDGQKGKLKKLLANFNDAVEKENWPRARKISKIKAEGAIDKAMKAINPFNWFKDTYDDCMEIREKIDEKILDEDDPSGLLNKGLDAFDLMVRRQQYSEAMDLGKDILNLKPHELATKHGFSTEQYEKVAAGANELMEKIGKAQNETSAWKHPIRSMKLSGLMRSVRDGSDQWGDEFFEEMDERLGEIMESLEYIPKHKIADQRVFNRVQELLQTIDKQDDNRSWIGSPIVKSQLGDLRSEVRSDPSMWDDETIDSWYDRLGEIDDEYTEGRKGASEESKQMEKRGNQLLEDIRASQEKFSWFRHPSIRKDLSNLENEVSASKSDWNEGSFSDWEERLKELDSEYKTTSEKNVDKSLAEQVADDIESTTDTPVEEKTMEAISAGVSEATKPADPIITDFYGKEALAEKPWLRNVDVPGDIVSEAKAEREWREKMEAVKDATTPAEFKMTPELTAPKLEPLDLSRAALSDFGHSTVNAPSMTPITLPTPTAEPTAKLELRPNMSPVSMMPDYTGLFDRPKQIDATYGLGSSYMRDLIGGTGEDEEMMNLLGPRAKFASGGFVRKLGRFVTRPFNTTDASGKPVQYGEAGPEAILPLSNRPGNLLSRLGGKLGQLFRGKDIGVASSVTDEASVQASDQKSEPLVNYLAKNLYNAAGVPAGLAVRGIKSLPESLSKIGKYTQSLLSKNPFADMVNNMPTVPSMMKSIFGKSNAQTTGELTAATEKPEITTPVAEPAAPAQPQSVTLEGGDEIVKTNEELAEQIQNLNKNTEKMYKMMEAILSKEGIKVQGIDLLTKVVATTGSRPVQSGGNTTIIQTIPQESGIDLRKKAM